MIRGSNILDALHIDSMKSLFSHPKVGASWEGFVIEQLLKTEPYDELFFRPHIKEQQSI